MPYTTCKYIGRDSSKEGCVTRPKYLSATNVLSAKRILYISSKLAIQGSLLSCALALGQFSGCQVVNRCSTSTRRQESDDTSHTCFAFKSYVVLRYSCRAHQGTILTLLTFFTEPSEADTISHKSIAASFSMATNALTGGDCRPSDPPPAPESRREPLLPVLPAADVEELVIDEDILSQASRSGPSRLLHLQDRVVSRAAGEQGRDRASIKTSSVAKNSEQQKVFQRNSEFCSSWSAVSW